MFGAPMSTSLSEAHLDLSPFELYDLDILFQDAPGSFILPDKLFDTRHDIALWYHEMTMSTDTISWGIWLRGPGVDDRWELRGVISLDEVTHPAESLGEVSVIAEGTDEVNQALAWVYSIVTEYAFNDVGMKRLISNPYREDSGMVEALESAGYQKVYDPQEGRDPETLVVRMERLPLRSITSEKSDKSNGAVILTFPS